MDGCLKMAIEDTPSTSLSLLKSAQEATRGHKETKPTRTPKVGRGHSRTCGAGEQMGTGDAFVNQREGNVPSRGCRSAPATSGREDTTSGWDGDKGRRTESLSEDERMVSEADRGSVRCL